MSAANGQPAPTGKSLKIPSSGDANGGKLPTNTAAKSAKPWKTRDTTLPCTSDATKTAETQQVSSPNEDVTPKPSKKREANKRHNNRTHNRRLSGKTAKDTQPTPNDPFDVEVDPSIDEIRSEVKNGKCLKQALRSEKNKSQREKTPKRGNKPPRGDPIVAEGTARPEMPFDTDFEQVAIALGNIHAQGQTNTAYAPQRERLTWFSEIGPIEQTNTSYAPQAHCVEPTIERLLELREIARNRHRERARRVAEEQAIRADWEIVDAPIDIAPDQVPEVPANPALVGQLAAKKKDNSNVIRRRPAWYHRIIPGFKKFDSEFDFNKPINHRIGKLVDSKSVEPNKSGVIIADDNIIESLYFELRLKQNAEYPDRKLKLEHTLKLAQKWIETEKSEHQARGETFKTDTPTFVNKFQVTVQKAVDQADSKFLLQEENQQISRWKGFLPARLVGKPLMKRTC